MLNKLKKSLGSVPRPTKIGILGVVLVYLGTAGIVSYAAPWWMDKGDSALHIDYVLSVYQGHLPKYHDFVHYPVWGQLDPGYKTQEQRAAANPPLFYVLHAPFVGPLLQSGHWKKAIALGRSINLFFGVLTILALAWAGWVYGKSRKRSLAVAVPAIGVLNYQFLVLNENYALDVLLVFFIVLTFILWHKMLYHGLARRYVGALFLLSVLGMATKATYIVFLALSMLVVMIIGLRAKTQKLEHILDNAGLVALLGVVVLAAIGWFYYYWNYRISGKWYTAALPGDLPSRKIKSLHEVVTSGSLWANFYAKLTSNPHLSEVITAVAGLGGLVGLKRVSIKKLWQEKTTLILVALMILATVGTLGTQITHAVGVGNINFRYFLPVIFVFSLAISYGLLRIRFLRGSLVFVAAITMVLTSLMTFANDKTIRLDLPYVSHIASTWGKLHYELIKNGFPSATLAILAAVIVIGACLLAVPLFSSIVEPTKNKKLA